MVDACLIGERPAGGKRCQKEQPAAARHVGTASHVLAMGKAKVGTLTLQRAPLGSPEDHTGANLCRAANTLPYPDHR